MTKKALAIYVGLILSCLWSCKDMDSTYKEFIVPGGLVYVGKPTAITAHPGRNRVLLKWAKGSDPNVSHSRIYWNNYSDSISVNIEPTVDTVQVMIDDLQEQSYTFQVKSFDTNGNSSVPVEIVSRIYGDSYERGLLNRGLNQTEIDVNGTITFQWAPANISAGAYHTEVEFTDTLGKQQRIRYSATENTNSLSLAQPGTPMRFRTMYLPNEFAIDTFYTSYDMTGKLFLNKSNWKIVDFTSEHPGNDNRVANFIDGTPGTRWHSWVNGTSVYPHHATIDMGKEQTITEFGVYRTTFENGGDVRAPDKIQFLVSNDNKKWIDLGKYDFNRFINGEQLYPITNAPPSRYFKFVGLAGPEYYIVMGEISVYVK